MIFLQNLMEAVQLRILIVALCLINIHKTESKTRVKKSTSSGESNFITLLLISRDEIG